MNAYSKVQEERNDLKMKFNLKKSRIKKIWMSCCASEWITGTFMAGVGLAIATTSSLSVHADAGLQPGLTQ